MFLFWPCRISRLCTLHQGSIFRQSKPLKLTGIPSVRHISKNSDKSPKFVPFLDMVTARRTEARRSILVQVQSANSHKELYSYCSSIGTVKQMLHYSVGVEPMNFIIVEFAQETDVNNILSLADHTLDDSTGVVPVHSNFLWFKASSRRQPKLKSKNYIELAVENGTKIVKDVELRDRMKKCENVSEQMTVLYDSTKLNDVESRLRFLTANQIESAVKGMFPSAKAYPFGSSVNGCGKMGCDLDLVLRLTDDKKRENVRLVFHCKSGAGSERTNNQRSLETIGDLIQLFLPGCSQVRKIMQARVPIIKYNQLLTNVQCDLSMTNMSGVHMSDLLYIMGSIDDRVRPLIFAVRKWASEIGLTNSSPGRWITNFSLTLLVLAFLQNPVHSKPVLPSVNALVRLSESRDRFVTEDGINCTFLRNIDSYEHPHNNRETLESLLKEFFEFCSTFDFESKAISLNEAVPVPKPEHCALYIVNPLERGLNVSKNVSQEELERFKIEVRNAAWLMEAEESKKSREENRTNGLNWGLLNIFESRRKPNSELLYFALGSQKHQNGGRMINVNSLFEDQEDDADVVQEKIQFKNDKVKKEIDGIKKDTQDKLKELHKLQHR